MDMDDSMDQSILSQATTKSKSTKKATKGKSKASKSKKEEPAETESQAGIDEEVAQPEPSKPKRAGRGKKRTSEDIKDEPESIAQEEKEQSQPPVEPPAKRRATKTHSSSVARKYDYEQDDSVMADAEPVADAPSDEEPKRGRKPTKKSSKSRKESDVPVAPKASSKARAPRDSEIDAQIEAGLEEDIPEPVEYEQPKPLKKTKSTKKSKVVEKSPAPAPQQEAELDEDDEEPSRYDDVESIGEPVDEPIEDEPQVLEPPAPKVKATKGSKKGTKKAKSQEAAQAQSPEPRLSSRATAEVKDRSEHQESYVSVEIINKKPEPKPEAEEQLEKATKKSSKKKDGSTKEKKSKKSEKKAEQAPPPQSPVQERPEVESPVDEQDDEFDDADDLPDQLELVNAPQASSPAPQEPSPEPQSSHRKTPSMPAKTTKRYSDIPKEEHLAEALVSQSSPHEVRESRRTSKRSNQAVSPPPTHRSTPSPSPQSSDAENRPPSSRPSSSRPPVHSTPKHPEFRAALTVSTPSPSKRNPNAGFGPSGHPWTPVDIDEALYGESSDKENADISGLLKGVKGGLTSPEKKMTVQEWISWNAKNSEDKLKRECERLVGQFEKEGGRALQRLEAIECID